MKEELREYCLSIVRRHTGKCIGLTAGMALAICILLFGFWNVLFVGVLGVIGLFFGINADREGSTWENIKSCIPDDIHRWR